MALYVTLSPTGSVARCCSGGKLFYQQNYCLVFVRVFQNYTRSVQWGTYRTNHPGGAIMKSICMPLNAEFNGMHLMANTALVGHAVFIHYIQHLLT